MNSRDIEIGQHHFTLFYRNHADDLLSLRNELDIVSVRYFPATDETAKDCRRLFQECTPEILKVVTDVLEDNNNFFQNFDVGLKFIANRSHYLDKSLVDFTFYLDTKLRHKSLQAN